jgi:hypothetical protein
MEAELGLPEGEQPEGEGAPPAPAAPADGGEQSAEPAGEQSS